MLRKTHRARLSLLFLPPLAALAILALRLHHVQSVRHAHYQAKAAAQHSAAVAIHPKRGRIVTSDGEELALSTPAYAVYAETRLIESGHRELARQIAAVLGKSAAKIQAQLLSGKVIALARRVEPWRKDRLEEIKRALDLPVYSLRFEEEGRRHYPCRSLASHVVGYVGLEEFGDNRGLDGIELVCDERLRGASEEGRVARDAAQKSLGPLAEETYAGAFGDTIVLTLNASIQRAAEEALRERCVELEAIGGAVVALEVRSGRILAMASYPDFDISRFWEAGADQLRNRCVSFAYEPGSVMKIMTMAWLMHDNLITPESLFDCEGGSARVNGRRLRDSGSHLRIATVREIFLKSSNIGTNKAASLMEGPRFHEGLKRFGLGDATGVELPGESPGFLPPLSEWTGFTMTSLPIGYEERFTPLQLATAINAIANGGVLMKPYLIEEVRDAFDNAKLQTQPQRVRRVVDPRSAALTLHMMECVVQTGTGKKAALPGYRVGGKTGTARKYDPRTGGYGSGMYYASFCGVFPLSDPEVLVFAMIDEPQGDAYGGGAAAAPVFRRVAEEAARVRAIAPDAPEEEEELLGKNWVPPSRFAAEESLPVKDPLAAGASSSPLALSLGDPNAAPPQPEIDPNAWRMPNLAGLTMAEARDVLGALPAGPIEFAGAGLAISQRPEPGALLQPGAAVSLGFAPAGEWPPAPENAPE
jgi:cell division protein FtsI (penicillin-binding protein 3)